MIRVVGNNKKPSALSPQKFREDLLRAPIQSLYSSRWSFIDRILKDLVFVCFLWICCGFSLCLVKEGYGFIEREKLNFQNKVHRLMNRYMSMSGPGPALFTCEQSVIRSPYLAQDQTKVPGRAQTRNSCWAENSKASQTGLVQLQLFTGQKNN